MKWEILYGHHVLKSGNSVEKSSLIFFKHVINRRLLDAYESLDTIMVIFLWIRPDDQSTLVLVSSNKIKGGYYEGNIS